MNDNALLVDIIVEPPAVNVLAIHIIRQSRASPVIRFDATFQ